MKINLIYAIIVSAIRLEDQKTPRNPIESEHQVTQKVIMKPWCEMDCGERPKCTEIRWVSHIFIKQVQKGEAAAEENLLLF